MYLWGNWGGPMVALRWPWGTVHMVEKCEGVSIGRPAARPPIGVPADHPHGLLGGACGSPAGVRGVLIGHALAHGRVKDRARTGPVRDSMTR